MSVAKKGGCACDLENHKISFFVCRLGDIYKRPSADYVAFFDCCNSPLFMRRWFHMWRFFNDYLVSLILLVPRECCAS